MTQTSLPQTFLRWRTSDRMESGVSEGNGVDGAIRRGCGVFMVVFLEEQRLEADLA